MNRFNLEMEGVRLRLDQVRNDSGLIRCTFETEFLNVVDVRIPRRPAVMSIADLQRLVKYLRDHIGANTPHDIASSFTFVTYELDFQLHAQAGMLQSWDDGSFTLEWKFSCRPPSAPSGSIYVGFETQVQVAEILRWCGELEQLSA
jgi:hypothetical protein